MGCCRVGVRGEVVGVGIAPGEFACDRCRPNVLQIEVHRLAGQRPFANFIAMRLDPCQHCVLPARGPAPSRVAFGASGRGEEVGAIGVVAVQCPLNDAMQPLGPQALFLGPGPGQYRRKMRCLDVRTDPSRPT